jgi:hypothetical protein
MRRDSWLTKIICRLLGHNWSKGVPSNKLPEKIWPRNRMYFYCLRCAEPEFRKIEESDHA